MEWPRKGWLIAAALLLLLVLGTVVLIGYSRWSSDAQLRAAAQAIERRDFLAAGRALDGYLQKHANPDARLLAAQAARRYGDLAHALEHLQAYERRHGRSLELELEYQLLAVQQGDSAAMAAAFEECQSRPIEEHCALLLEALVVADLNRLAVPLSEELPLSAEEATAELPRLRDAAELWLKTQTALPDRVQGLVWRGRARGLGSDHSGAVSDYEEALALDPQHFEARAYLALSIAQQRPSEALAHLELLHRRFPEDVRITYAVATTQRRLGDPAAASALLDEVLRLLPDHSQVLIERGLVEIDQRQPRRALDFLLRAEALDANSRDAQSALVRCMTMLNDPVAAQHHQQRFLALEAATDKPTSSSTSGAPKTPRQRPTYP